MWPESVRHRLAFFALRPSPGSDPGGLGNAASGIILGGGLGSVASGIAVVSDPGAVWVRWLVVLDVTQDGPWDFSCLVCLLLFRLTSAVLKARGGWI